MTIECAMNGSQMDTAAEGVYDRGMMDRTDMNNGIRCSGDNPKDSECVYIGMENEALILFDEWISTS